MKITEIYSDAIVKATEPEEVVTILSNIWCASTKPDPDKFPIYKEGTIFDIDQTVRWNQNAVAKANNAYREEEARLKNIRASLVRDCEEKVIDLLFEEYKGELTLKQIWIIWRDSYDANHACLSDVLSGFYDRADLALKVLAANE